MSQNQLITLLALVLLLVIAGSATVLLTSMPNEDSTQSPETTAELTGAEPFRLEVLDRPAYQLLNKQLVKEGALPVQPATNSGKANPFL